MAVLLALVTLLAYLPVARDGFVVYDDGTYVTENTVVQNGLTWAGVKWAFTTWHGGNWHPVTWLSHMTDCELFGLNAGAHHSVNLLLHAANGALLLLLLFRLTGALWPSAFVAALFAWHPLHVESVAWIAERKDVLSTFFALLALLFHARYAQKRSKVEGRESSADTAVKALDIRRSTLDYFLALVFFALGLMAKPMLVTLPFVMLLLDYWPLQRLPDFKFRMADLVRLALEKWPFFVLAAVSCTITFLAQRHGEAVMTLGQFPLNLRIENALISCLLYLSKTAWPAHLAILYPLVIHLSWMRAMTAVAVAVLGVFSWLAWRLRRSCPYALMGWLWFLGMLVPVIGLVQVGSAAMADRYSYLPIVGLFIVTAFGARDLVQRFQPLIIPAVIAAALVLAACLALTGNQLRFWRDNESLFAHAVAVTKENGSAHLNYGVAIEEKGRQADALAQYREAMRLDPENPMAHYDIGNLLDKMGRPAEALPELFQAVRLNPKSPIAHNTLGCVLAEMGRFDEAMSEFSLAARADAAYPWPYFQMGKALLGQGRDTEALGRFREALRIAPDNFQILAYTARVLAADENPDIRDGKAALALAIKANALSGGAQPLVLDMLGMACAETGDFTNALTVAQNALDLAAAAKMKNIEPLQQRLELYKNRQPWRESFRATNAPPP
jgi:tetratricopeptide (TPR) repeat protein